MKASSEHLALAPARALGAPASGLRAPQATVRKAPVLMFRILGHTPKYQSMQATSGEDRASGRHILFIMVIFIKWPWAARHSAIIPGVELGFDMHVCSHWPFRPKHFTA